MFCFSVKQNKKVCFGRNDGLISLLCLQSLFVRPFFFFVKLFAWLCDVRFSALLLMELFWDLVRIVFLIHVVF